MVCLVLLVGLCVLSLFWLFSTDYGLSLLAYGENPLFVRSYGLGGRALNAIGMALANGLVGLGGALFAHMMGFADVNMGLGTLIQGMASLMLGELFLGKKNFQKHI